MRAADTSDRIDILPILLIGLVIIYLFILLRPPVLMLLYDLRTESAPPGEPVTQIPAEHLGGTQTTAPLATMKAPSLPALLQQPVAGWPTAPAATLATEILNQEIEKLTNATRQKYGHSNLEIDPKLREIAVQHSWDMLTRNYMDHISPDGIGPAQRVGKYHRRLFGLSGENVASKDSPTTPIPQMAKDFMDIWINSPGHRRNILSPDYNRIGTGCYQQQSAGQEQRRCTQLFALVYALAEEDIPEVVTAGQTIPVRIRPVEGSPMPTQLTQLGLSNGSEASTAALTPSGDIAVGQITLNGPPGVYALQLNVPDRQNSGRYWIVPGPYVTVR